MTWKAWLHAVAGAFIGGAASGLSAVIVAPQTFNFSLQGWENIGKLGLVAGVIAALAVLKQSPLPSESITVEKKTTSTVSTTNNT